MPELNNTTINSQGFNNALYLNNMEGILGGFLNSVNVYVSSSTSTSVTLSFLEGIIILNGKTIVVEGSETYTITTSATLNTTILVGITVNGSNGSVSIVGSDTTSTFPSNNGDLMLGGTRDFVVASVGFVNGNVTFITPGLTIVRQLVEPQSDISILQSIFPDNVAILSSGNISNIPASNLTQLPNTGASLLSSSTSLGSVFGTLSTNETRATSSVTLQQAHFPNHNHGATGNHNHNGIGHSHTLGNHNHAVGTHNHSQNANTWVFTGTFSRNVRAGWSGNVFRGLVTSDSTYPRGPSVTSQDSRNTDTGNVSNTDSRTVGLNTREFNSGARSGGAHRGHSHDITAPVQSVRVSRVNW